MPQLPAFLRGFGFWLGPVFLLGSLLLAWPVIIVAAYFLPATLLLLLPLGGLALGVRLIVGGTQPLWAKLLALLSPVLVPLLVVVGAGLLLPAEDHLTFLIPMGFRGEVAVVQQEPSNVFQERDKDDIMLSVPANGLVTTTAFLTSDELAMAEYYLVSPTGERVTELRLLDHLSPYANFASPADRAEWQQVGIFTQGLQHKTIPLGYDCPSCPVQETPYLSFIVGCYDSLGSARYLRNPF